MAYTTLVPATAAWLLDPTNPTGPVLQCGTRRAGQPGTVVQQGEVIQYAGGRTESAVYDGQTGTVTITLANLTAAGVAQLDAWLGTVLCLRTFEGGRFFGSYFDTSEQVYTRPGIVDVTVTMQAVTYTDVV